MEISGIYDSAVGGTYISVRGGRYHCVPPGCGQTRESWVKTSVRILFFATAREAVGTHSVDREVPAGGSTLTALLASLVKEHPRLEPLLKGSRFVRNGRYVRGTGARVRPGDEVAVHPPYSGG
jgi:sulfur-carrier protein